MFDIVSVAVHMARGDIRVFYQEHLPQSMIAYHLVRGRGSVSCQAISALANSHKQLMTFGAIQQSLESSHGPADPSVTL